MHIYVTTNSKQRNTMIEGYMLNEVLHELLNMI